MDEQSKKTALDWALYYRQQGFSVIPIRHAEKVPPLKWEQFQNRIASEDELLEWYKKWPDACVGIVTGEISNIVVIDVDQKNGGFESQKNLHFPPTPAVKTGNGSHYYFKYPVGKNIRNSSGSYAPGIDCRANGGYVVAPRSVHFSGNNYEWVIPLDDIPLAELPEWALERIKDSKNTTDWKEFLDKEIHEGTRNMSAAQIAGVILSKLPRDFWELGWATMKEWNNSKVNPPLNEDELRDVFDSIASREQRKCINKKEYSTTADDVDGADDEIDISPSKSGKVTRQLLDIAEEKIIEFFNDEMHEAYVVIPSNGHNEIVNCSSKAFKMWLAHEYWQKTKQGISSTPLNTAVTTIQGRACFDGPEIHLNNRVCWHDGALWYDLSDPEWRAVRIDHSGWQIVNNPPILFKRYLHQKCQIEPTSGGNINELLKFINVTDKDNENLLLVWLVSCFIPDFPHPILNVFGTQGSAKSFLCELIKELVDPSKTKRMSFPRTADFAQVCQHNHLLLFDNISFLYDSTSDKLCKAVTGDGISKRVLYSDDEDYIYNFRRCIILNGVNLIGKNPDFLERSILLRLERIPEEKRKPESIVLDRFNEIRPQILGAIFDALSKALAIKDSIKIDRLPRMADFALWGCAIAEAIGLEKEAFMSAYEKSIEAQNEEALNESLVAQVIIRFMETKEEWNGTPTELLNELSLPLKGLFLDGNLEKDRSWPKRANQLMRKINCIKPNLATVGIQVSEVKERGQRRLIIRKTSSPSSQSDSGSSNDLPDFLSTDTPEPMPEPEQGEMFEENDAQWANRAYRDE